MTLGAADVAPIEISNIKRVQNEKEETARIGGIKMSQKNRTSVYYKDGEVMDINEAVEKVSFSFSSFSFSLFSFIYLFIQLLQKEQRFAKALSCNWNWSRQVPKTHQR